MTEDLDILVSFESTGQHRQSGLIILTPILSYLAAKGYTAFRGEGIEIEGWPVQFLPVADDLDAEALMQALALPVTIAPSVEPAGTCILRPEHIVATALKVGRPKDRSRILQFIEEDAVDLEALAGVLGRHDLQERWTTFCATVGLIDPCNERSEQG